MSIAAMQWARRQKCRTAPKFVLFCLADYANEEGSSWPSLDTVAEFTSMTIRGVRIALRELEECGLLITEHRDGRSSRYWLQLHLSGTPERGSSPQHLPQKPALKSKEINGAKSAPLKKAATPECGSSPRDPGTSFLPTPEGHSSPTPERRSSTPERGSGTPERGSSITLNNHQRTLRGGGAREARPGPLAEDWKPSEAEAAFAVGLGLNLERVAQRFRRHFLATGACFADWSARWETWCTEDAENAPAEDGAAAPEQPAATKAPGRDAEGLDPKERALANEFLAIMREERLPEDHPRRIRARNVLKELYRPAWAVVCSQLPADFRR